MYCPNCGKKTAAPQQYCRFCGLALEQIVQSLAEQRPANSDESWQQQKERLEQWGCLALGVCGVGVLIPLLYKIVKLLVAGQIFDGLGILAVVIIVGSGLLAAILFEEAKKIEAAKNKGRLPPPEELPQGETTRELLPEARLEPVPSVTERTTELLFAEKKSPAKES